ncbi:MAG: DUF4214 domain-containing protein [Acidimicrobiales bacterium]
MAAAAVAVAASTVVVLGPATPASAGVSVAVAGTTITVTVTGNDYVGPGCDGTNVRINGVVTSPVVPCATFSHLTVNGDSGNQIVYGQNLDEASFPAHPYLTASLGAGSDTAIASLRPDAIDTGAGSDSIVITAGGALDSSLQLGADEDFLQVTGTGANDTFTATSGSPNLALAWSNGSSSFTYQAQNAEILSVHGGAGNDTVNASAVSAASVTDRVDVDGDTGNDTFTAGPVPTNFEGGTGTNTMNGGSAADIVSSRSHTDVIHLAGGGGNYVYDRSDPVFGGRTIDTASTENGWSAELGGTDAVLRVRPARTAGESAVLTSSLARPGQQVLPSGFRYLNADLKAGSSIDDRGLLDTVVPPSPVSLVEVYGDDFDDDLADITEPSGAWTTSGTAATLLIIDSPGYASVHVGNMGAVSIHGPWTDKAKGFVHRSTRDLLFRFPSGAERDTTAAKLTNGTLTRAELVSSLMGTDEYRGLDVDRTFVKYLRRKADSGGRSYWIGSIRNGKALWRFRAQLFGSNEYFTKAGGTNADYVTQAYTDVLNRAPDPSGKAYWTNKLNNGADRGSVALQFINSPEARRRLVDDQFLRFLDRKPTSTEQATWVAALPGATGEQDLIAYLAGSSSYYNRS